jgi:hypothetical protein
LAGRPAQNTRAIGASSNNGAPTRVKKGRVPDGTRPLLVVTKAALSYAAALS